MDSDRSQPSSPLVSEGDFGFAFNDVNFSDRLLRLEITGGGSLPSFDDDDGFRSCFWVRDRKRRREDAKKDNNKITNNVLDLTESLEEHELNENQPDSDDCADTENQDEETLTTMEEESQSGDEDAGNELNWRMDCTAVERVRELHISSPILAAKSPFFYKLFSNRKGESEQRHVTLRVESSEEAALMELLKFMYSNTLSVTSPAALLDVLMAADKFEVASCVRHCSRLLRNLPMTPESAMLYLELPSNLVMADAVQPLMDASRQFLATRFKDINRFQEEVMALPLTGIEAILSSDDLQISSEDAVYDLVVKWARTHYPVLEERREILCSNLACCIRFPYMTGRKLRKVLTSDDFDHEFVSKLVLEALFFKAEAPHRQRSLTADGLASTNRRFISRAYKYRPLTVLEFELPRPQCLVYLDLKREDCASLYPSGRVYSQAFHLGGQGFFLSAHCNMDQQSSVHCFGLFLGMQEKGSAGFTVDYDFASRSKPTEEFVSKYKGNYTFTAAKLLVTETCLLYHGHLLLLKIVCTSSMVFFTSKLNSQSDIRYSLLIIYQSSLKISFTQILYLTFSSQN